MKWTDKEGKEWELWQMSDRHLLNTKNMILRLVDQMHDQAQVAYSYPGQGEMATYYADRAGSSAMEEASAFQAVANAIDDEIVRRKQLWEKFKK